MKKIIAFMTVMLIIALSCTKDNLDNLEYFSFGDSHGFCQGDCTNFFIIKDQNVYPDDMEQYTETMIYKSDALPIEKYNLAKKLINKFPSYLADNPDKTFGCPDCVDQGAIHIEVKVDGQIKRWHFDTNISNLPSRIQDYIQEISYVIGQLK